MKEIKFRFWDKELNELRYLDLEDLCEDDYWFDGETSVWWALHDSQIPQERFVCMQYTGLKEKNGKEIYKGDIVKENNSIGEIIYDCCEFRINWKINKDFYNNSLAYHYEHVEIIGNIYENTNLLKEEQ